MYSKENLSGHSTRWVTLLLKAWGEGRGGGRLFPNLLTHGQRVRSAEHQYPVMWWGNNFLKCIGLRRQVPGARVGIRKPFLYLDDIIGKVQGRICLWFPRKTIRDLIEINNNNDWINKQDFNYDINNKLMSITTSIFVIIPLDIWPNVLSLYRINSIPK